jgi:hypothetical protein
VPAAFVCNEGQWPPHVLAAASHGGNQTWLERDAIVLRCPIDAQRCEVFRLHVVGADRAVELAAAEPLDHTVSFFRGDDPRGWHAGLTAFRTVRLRNVLAGVDVGVTTSEGAPEYFLDLADGAQLDRIVIRCEGQRELRERADGCLVIAGEHGELVQEPPAAFRRLASGASEPVAVRLVRRGDDAFGFAVEGAADQPLLVDPVLRWATFAGGSAYEWGYGVARAMDGSVVVTGETTSSDFPTTAGVFDPTYNGFGPPTSDVFVARFTAAGAIVYATYLGGSAGDRPFATTVDAQGSVVVVGNSMSSGFPTTVGAYDRILSGSSDGFVTKLAPNGAALVFSTFLGGDTTETAEAVALDGNARCWVVGTTSSATFPTTPGAVQAVRQGSSDAYVACLSADGSTLVASTLLGGNDGDVAKGVAVAPDGSIWCGGITSSTNFPTTSGAPQSVLSGSSDAFLSHVSADAGTLLASTLFGGSSGDVGEGVAVSADGLPVLVGVTSSANFPTTPNAFQQVAHGSSDAFVAGFGPGPTVRFVTLCGGGGGDVAKAVVIDPSGSILFGGQTSSSDYPTTPDAVLGTGSGSADAFVTHLAADGRALLFSTLLGGSGSDGGEDLAAADAAAVALTGVTNSGNFPVTAGAWSGTQRGTNDAFLVCLDARPAGIVSYGLPSPNCGGADRISASRRPDAGAADFALLCTGAPAGAFGFLVCGFASAPGVPLYGILAYLDLATPLFTVGTFSDAIGFARVGLPLTGVPSGTTAFAQFVWLNPVACGTASLLSASDALQFVTQ